MAISPTRNSIFTSKLPAVGASGDSLYFANNTMLAGARKYFEPGGAENPFKPWGLQGKVSPLVSRYSLGTVRPLVLLDGQANLFFRGSRVTPGRLHEIQRSTDLEMWEVLGTRYAAEIGGIDFVDSEPPADGGYYRAVPLGN